MNNADWLVMIRQAGELNVSPDYLAITVAVATAVLAIITLFYMIETRRMRITTENILKASQQPSFALEPTTHILGGGFLQINLVNHGQTASNIEARCVWLDNLDSSGSSKDFFIFSLAKDGYAGLDVPIKEIVDTGKVLKLEITCKDAGGKDYKTTLLLEFGKLKGTNTTIAYQNNYHLTLHNALDRIGRELGNITSKIDRLGR